MTKQMKKSNIRISTDDYQRITDAARRAGMSTNHYLITAGLAYATDRDLMERVAELIDTRMREQSEAVKGEIEKLVVAANDANKTHAEHNEALREKLNTALHTIDERVSKGVAAMTRGAITAAQPRA